MSGQECTRDCGKILPLRKGNLLAWTWKLVVNLSRIGGKRHPRYTEKYTCQREAISKVGGECGCRGARSPTRWASACLGWGGHRITDFQGISVEDSQHLHQARHTVGRSAGKSRNLSQALKVEYQPQKSQPIQFYGQHEDPRRWQKKAIPADLVLAPQRQLSMLRCQDALAG